MTRHCACGKAWEGEGACPQCFLLQAVKVERLEEKVGQLQQGFASLVKIAADTPTAAPKPPGIGPLMSAAWRIRQLGKERVEALEKVRNLEEQIESFVEEFARGLTTNEAEVARLKAAGLEAWERSRGTKAAREAKQPAPAAQESQEGEELEETLGKLRGEEGERDGEKLRGNAQ